MVNVLERVHCYPRIVIVALINILLYVINSYWKVIIFENI